MAKCKKCENYCFSGSKFCTNCGTKAPDDIEMRCPNCNRLIFEDYLFCENCGKKVNKKKLKKIVIKK
ncbi:MAG: zinc ribbon domain-containing protein [Patescibacteria group bacterium]|nr:zinc ribbon domain-containing protein [Patescibacteria group bacterium]